ncbi:MAG: hypothetical protein HY446_01170, partial [Candidatus Niyogibacteria bacterium]|nr:hypothetical protein [Candidatus Niyogibacteria bacterium]
MPAKKTKIEKAEKTAKKPEPKAKPVKASVSKYLEAVGRRKTSTARVRLHEG